MVRYSVSHPRYYILEAERGPLGRAAKGVYDRPTYPLAFWRARDRESFETPPGLRRRRTLERLVHERRNPLSAIEREYGDAVDRDTLSARGRDLLCD
jgi:hypothetical protein